MFLWVLTEVMIFITSSLHHITDLEITAGSTKKAKDKKMKGTVSQCLSVISDNIEDNQLYWFWMLLL